MKARLTDRTIKNLSAETGKYLEVWDKLFHMPGASFGVRVSGTTGSLTWILLYARSKRLVLGRYPALNLKEATDTAWKVASEILANERDPVAERKAAKAAPTFKAVAEQFVREYPKIVGLRPRTVADYTRGVNRELLPRWEGRKADSISRKDAIAVLDDIRLNHNSPVQSNRTRAFVDNCLTRQDPRVWKRTEIQAKESGG